MEEPSVLHDLNGQLDAEKFAYLLSVLYCDESRVTPNNTVEEASRKEASFSECSSPPNSGKYSGGVVCCGGRDAPWKGRPTEVSLPFSLSAGRGRPNVLDNLSSSSESSTCKSSKSSSANLLKSEISGTSRDSVRALHYNTITRTNSDRGRLLIRQSNQELDKAYPPLLTLPASGKKGNGEKFSRDCNRLPVCKRLLNKFTSVDRRNSLSSSVESVIAETLPDLDTHFSKIAGKIANEPVNPFPILKTPKKPKKSKSLGSFLASSRVEHDINQELRKLQDYKDVNELFRGHKAPKAKTGDKVSVSCLARQITNPLYKTFDPTGYHKTEDELAIECIQMVCDDFNDWIALLSKDPIRHDKPGVSPESESKKEQNQVIIGPEFLLQILRKQLELPEEKPL